MRVCVLFITNILFVFVDFVSLCCNVSLVLFVVFLHACVSVADLMLSYL